MHELSLDMIHFIREVRKYRQIWDINHDDFNTKRSKRIWPEIAGVLVQGYYDMERDQQLDVARQVYKKWRNLRDTHIRTLKLQQRAPLVGRRRSPYLYGKHLSFLNTLYNFKSNTDDQATDNEHTNREIAPTTATSAVGFATNYLTSTSDDDTRSPKMHEQSANRAIEFVDTPMTKLEENYSRNAPPLDEDQSFFESMLPAVRELSMDQKLEFRCEVLKVIKNMRTNLMNNNISLLHSSSTPQLNTDVFDEEEVKVFPDNLLTD